MFVADDETNSIVMIGEIGGSAEEDGAQFLKFGHKNQSSASSPALRRPQKAHGPCRRHYLWRQSTAVQIEAMQSAGIHVSASPARLGETMLEA